MLGQVEMGKNQVKDQVKAMERGQGREQELVDGSILEIVKEKEILKINL